MRPLNIMELYSDTYYIERIQAGDTASFACLLDRYSRLVYSLILRIVRNKEDAEELTQDVFMKVFNKLGSFKGDSSFSTWIYRIAYNTAISEVRKNRPEHLAIEESVMADVSEDEIAGSLGSVGENEQTRRLDAALELLSPDERAIVLFFYMEDKAIEDIANITGLSIANVKVKLHRIRKKLFVLLKKMEELEQ